MDDIYRAKELGFHPLDSKVYFGKITLVAVKNGLEETEQDENKKDRKVIAVI